MKTSALIILVLFTFTIQAQENQKRNRGESFFNLRNSNTAGHGDVWLTFRGVGHIWDDDPIKLDTLNKVDRKWISNFRAFPEFRAEGGLFNIASVSLESRVLSYGFRPGYLSLGLKLTTPDNLDLRLNGFGIEFSFLHQFSESNPTLGGYTGFMPEGFVVKGNSMEIRLLYEFDLLAKYSKLPFRFISNLGSRIPFREDRLDCVQFLLNTGIVYSGYGFDLFAMYSIEAFKNFFSPIKINEQGNKTIAVYFRENPMYIVLGGNVRYDNGLILSFTTPLLVSKNRQSRMSIEDLVELHRKTDPSLFSDEKKRGIRDPFDPWYVKWKLTGSITFPIRFKMTSAEMMRNYLIQKNRKRHKNINIDKKIEDQQKEDLKRLEELRMQKEEIINSD